MNQTKYKYFLIFIGATVLLTIVMQVYWNYKEFNQNKSQLISSVQSSLDNAVESYFSNITRSGIIAIPGNDSITGTGTNDTIHFKTRSRGAIRRVIDSTIQNLENGTDKPILIKKGDHQHAFPFITKNDVFPKNIDSLISKVFIQITRDTLNLEKLDGYFKEELERKDLDLTYGFKYQHGRRYQDENANPRIKEYNLDQLSDDVLVAKSNPNYLPPRSKLEVYFNNDISIILRNSMLTILFSLILITAVILSIYYLLKTIYRQKQLAEVKNDLISNITHEFKTPIATISTALEAMKSFNALNDKEKSEKYIDVANTQVVKLNTMVEKILETSTLTNEELVLKKDPVVLNDLLEKLIAKKRIISPENEFLFENNCEDVSIDLDEFHFENAIGNIYNNAIKYGGPKCWTNIHCNKTHVVIEIHDNGSGIPKHQKDKVFEQFYRIPTGNTHDVKGFGIGLYYSKKIIEKHFGTIFITYNKEHQTVFKIELPHGR